MAPKDKNKVIGSTRRGYTEPVGQPDERTGIFAHRRGGYGYFEFKDLPVESVEEQPSEGEGVQVDNYDEIS